MAGSGDSSKALGSHIKGRNKYENKSYWCANGFTPVLLMRVFIWSGEKLDTPILRTLLLGSASIERQVCDSSVSRIYLEIMKGRIYFYKIQMRLLITLVAYRPVHEIQIKIVQIQILERLLEARFHKGRILMTFAPNQLAPQSSQSISFNS